MTDMLRRSPVVFPQEAKQVEIQDHWSVVTEYESEGQGPWVVDLSHRPRWDLQDSELERFNPFEIDIPEAPGQCCFKNNVLANRMNGTQVSLWQLTGAPLEAPDDTAYTETVDATLFLAILGKAVFSITEKLSALDFGDPAIRTPRLFQGPFAHVPCQIVLLGQSGDMPGILLTCSRGYARDMVESILHSGSEFKLQPAGQAVFEKWLDRLT
jgi:hypothetical protein